LTHMYDVARDLTATYVDHEFMWVSDRNKWH
jgi:hypothetical protein